MEVILREHVENLGQRGDVVKVADGYARNYLLPRKLALTVTEGNRKQIERERKVADMREAEERQGAEAIAARLGQLEIVDRAARRRDRGALRLGHAAPISPRPRGQGLEVERRKIQLAEPIKQLGEFQVPIRLHRDVTAQREGRRRQRGIVTVDR